MAPAQQRLLVCALFKQTGNCITYPFGSWAGQCLGLLKQTDSALKWERKARKINVLEELAIAYTSFSNSNETLELPVLCTSPFKYEIIY